jgi:TPR repeat protein
MTQEQQTQMQNLERRIQQLEREQKKTGDTAGTPASQGTLATDEVGLQATCHNGTLEACVSLAELYLKGGEIPADPQRAAQLYEQACSGQNGKACTNLGLLYYQGIGVSKDLPRAKEFFQRGCRFHDKLGCTFPGGMK